MKIAGRRIEIKREKQSDGGEALLEMQTENVTLEVAVFKRARLFHNLILWCGTRIRTETALETVYS